MSLLLKAHLAPGGRGFEAEVEAVVIFTPPTPATLLLKQSSDPPGKNHSLLSASMTEKECLLLALAQPANQSFASLWPQ